MTWFEIAAPGIEKIEGESEFQPRDRYPGIKITATGSNVITLGDGNVVNAQYRELHWKLNSLKQAVADSDSLTEPQKLEIAVDIESLKDQLAKLSPSKTVIGYLWLAIEKAVTAAGFIYYVAKITPMIAGLLP